MKFLNKIFIFGFALVLWGCNNKSNGGSQMPPVLSVSDVSQITSFENLKSAPDNETEKIGPSCELEKDVKLDSSLAVDDSVYVSLRIHSQKGTYQSDAKITVKEVSLDSIRIEMKNLSIVASQANGEILKKPLTEEQVCGPSLESDPTGIQCEPTAEKTIEELEENYLTDKGIHYFKSNPVGLSRHCQIHQPISAETKTETGIYHFQNDQKVEAVLATTTTTGIVFCENQEMGLGEVVDTKLASSQLKAIPGLLQSTCEGAEFLSATTIKVGEKIVYSTRVEISQPQMK